MRRISLLIFCLALTSMSFAAIYSGSCGESMTWTMNTAQKTLSIQGTGEMEDSPWREYDEYEEIEKVTIGIGVTSIQYDAFWHFISLKSVSLPNTLESIGVSAFESCSSLRSIIIPNSMLYIGERAFLDCKLLSSVSLSGMITRIEKYTFCACESLSSITLPNSVTSIGEYAFGDCISISSISLPDALTEIDALAFAGCESLTEIRIPNNITEIKRRTFMDCSSLVSVIFPDGLTSIGEEAFYDCSSLDNVSIPNSVVSIERFAFSHCGMTSVTIPAGVMEIGKYAFGGGLLSSFNVDDANPYFTSVDGILYNKGKTVLVCYPSKKSNETFSIPNSVKIIEEWAVWNKYIKTLIIPSSVSKIRANAFYGSDFTSVVNYAETPQEIDSETFIYGSHTSHGECTLYVPKESIQWYRNAEGWKDFSDIKSISEYLDVQIVPSNNGSNRKLLQNGQIYIQQFDGTCFTIEGKRL